MDSVVSDLNSEFPGRHRQVDQLTCHLASCWPAIFVNGPPATGKTALLKRFLEKCGAWFAWINCVEAHNNKLIFQVILDQLGEFLELSRKKRKFFCGDFVEFLDCFKELADNYKDQCQLEESVINLIKRKCFIVFDVSQNLLQNDVSLLTSFCRLQELTDHKLAITCIFISTLPLESFYGAFHFPVIKIEFDAYAKKDLLSILMMSKPKEISADFYQNYLELTLNVVCQFTRNLIEVHHICQRNLPIYIEPVASGELSQKESAKLWHRFQDHLTDSINLIALKIDSDKDVVDEMPVCTKYLLIAAFLASYNSPKSDRRFFVKLQNKTRRKANRKTLAKEIKCSGPKAFPFERLLHIYKSIIYLNSDGNSDNSFETDSLDMILSQIELLVQLKLLNRAHLTANHDWLSSVTKYVVSDSVSLDFIHEVATTLKFNVTSFLEHFAIRQ